MHQLLDKYSVKARWKPVLIATLPIPISVVLLFPNVKIALSIVWALASYAGCAFLLSEIARDLGKKMEERLFAKWGGKPTTALLRWRGSSNLQWVQSLHSAIEARNPSLSPLPSETDESVDEVKADNKYETCVAWLREHTRDRAKYALVFEENCNYGFRRNLYGLRFIGFALSTIQFLLVVVLMYVHMNKGESVDAGSLVSAIVALSLMVMWSFLVRESWVKAAAFAYAQRLLNSVLTS